MRSFLRRVLRRDARPRELDVVQAYASWAGSYEKDADNPLLLAEQMAVTRLLPNVSGRVVLDLACGTGRYTRLLTQAGAARCVGLDLSRAMLARADRTLMSCAQGDLLALPFPNARFDVIVCGLALGYVDNLTTALTEIGRVLVPRGEVIYSDFHPLLSLGGARREFTGADGRRYSIKSFAHLYEDHVAACRAAGLEIVAVREPRVGREIVGEGDVFRKWQGWPAALVLHAVRI